MTTKGNPDKAALLVIDVQNDVVANAYKRDEVVANIVKMVDHARACDVPVIWIQHEAEDLPRDSEAWKIVPELVPNDGELHVYKEYSDSFADTNLAEVLAGLDVGHLVISGAQTNACVRATTYRAAGEGFDVSLVGDAHTLDEFEVGDVTLDPRVVITDLNIALQFLEWPNQAVTSISTADVLAM